MPRSRGTDASSGKPADKLRLTLKSAFGGGDVTVASRMLETLRGFDQ